MTVFIRNIPEPGDDYAPAALPSERVPGPDIYEGPAGAAFNTAGVEMARRTIPSLTKAIKAHGAVTTTESIGKNKNIPTCLNCGSPAPAGTAGGLGYCCSNSAPVPAIDIECDACGTLS